MGYQLLVSVPYSLYSLESEMVNGNTVESNVPANSAFTDNQTISIDSDSLYIENGNAISLNNISSADNDWTINGNDLENNNTGNVGIGNTNLFGKLNVFTDPNNQNTYRAVYIDNSTSNSNEKMGVYATVNGGGSGDNTGAWFDAMGNATGINIGVGGLASGNAGENRGVYGSAQSGTSNWAGYFDSGDVKVKNKLVIGENFNPGGFQLIDGNQGSGRILKSDAQGNAQWVQIGSLGVGVMLKNNYDSNNNSIVDNAENAQLINGYQVGTNVPQNADFTDDQNATEVNYNNNNSGLTANNTQAAIDELNNNIGNSGNMHTANYDANQNGIVDTAENVNGFQVNSNVPQNADFTDHQTLSSNGLDASNVVRLEISNGNYVDVNLSALNNSGTDNQNLTGANFNHLTNVLTIDIQNGNSVSVNLSDLINTDNQNLTISTDDSLFISGGTGVDLSNYANAVNNDNDPTNEIQALTISNNTISLSNNGGSVTIPNEVYINGSNIGVATNYSSSGSFNTATGQPSLSNITNGSGNSAYGDASLINNTTGSSNSAYGRWTLGGTTTGSNNSGIGYESLKTNTTGSNNSAFGAHADVSSGNLTNATAIGANAIVSQSNSLVLGNDANVGIGTSSPTHSLSIENSGNVDVGLKSSTGNAKIYLQSSSGNSTINFKESGSNVAEMGWDNGNDRFYIYENGATSLAIKNQKVGIGTSNPQKTLHVYGQVTNYPSAEPANGNDGVFIDIQNAGLGYQKVTGIRFKTKFGLFENAYYNAGIFFRGNPSDINQRGTLYFSNRETVSLTSVGTADADMVITSNGNIGIGTDSPERNLHINDVMRLEPRSSAPNSPSEGDIYFNGTTKKLMVYNGSTWKACW